MFHALDTDDETSHHGLEWIEWMNKIKLTWSWLNICGMIFGLLWLKDISWWDISFDDILLFDNSLCGDIEDIWPSPDIVFPYTESLQSPENKRNKIYIDNFY